MSEERGINSEALKEAEGMSLSDMMSSALGSSSQEEAVSESVETEAIESSEESVPSPTETYEQLLAEENAAKENVSEEGSEDESNDTESLSVPASSQDSLNSDIEEVKVRGLDGKKSTLKIDYSDKKAVKDAFIKAAGMRKFQKERDEFRDKFSAISKEFETHKAEIKPLEDAFEQGGAEAVVKLLGGDEAWEEAVNKTLEHREYVAGLSAEEKYKLKMDEERSKREKEIAAANTKYEQLANSVKQQQEEAELKELEAIVHPSFDRYRFSGKLGDASAENSLDTALWNTAQQTLMDYPEDVEITKALADKAFRDAANSLNKVIKMQTEKKVKKTIENKKADTAKRARVAAKKGLGGNTKRTEAIQAAMKGDLSGALANLWSK